MWDYLLDSIDLLLNPNPIGYLRLINKLISCDDSLSKITLSIAKSELDIAKNIIANFEYEGNKSGALQRIITHLESANALCRKEYTESENLIGISNLVFLSDKMICLFNDIIFINFCLLGCHKLECSHDNIYIDLLVDKTPHSYDYHFLKYSNGIKQIIGSELYEYVINERKSLFLNKMSTNVINIKEHQQMYKYQRMATYDPLVKVGHKFIKSLTIDVSEEKFYKFLRERLSYDEYDIFMCKNDLKYKIWKYTIKLFNNKE